MNIKHPVAIVMGILTLPVFAFAQTQAQTQTASEQSSTWGNLFWGIFPFIILIAIFIPTVRRMQKPIIKRTQEHMERVEQSLDRIIKLLEKKD